MLDLPRFPRPGLANVPSHGNLYVNDNELMMSTAP